MEPKSQLTFLNLDKFLMESQMVNVNDFHIPRCLFEFRNFSQTLSEYRKEFPKQNQQSFESLFSLLTETLACKTAVLKSTVRFTRASLNYRRMTKSFFG